LARDNAAAAGVTNAEFLPGRIEDIPLPEASVDVVISNCVVNLAVHVIAGLTAVISGAVAALTRKGSPQHIKAGRWFYRAITVVFATATALAVMRWRQDDYLLIIGAVTALATPATSPAWASATPRC
ncbi:MAG: methyltransferase domain-containing protein, partial [Streptosporangiaceae bacterium]